MRLESQYRDNRGEYMTFEIDAKKWIRPEIDYSFSLFLCKMHFLYVFGNKRNATCCDEHSSTSLSVHYYLCCADIAAPRKRYYNIIHYSPQREGILPGVSSLV